jgi:hypothetical protein
MDRGTNGTPGSESKGGRQKPDPYNGVCLIDLVRLALICRNDNNLLTLTTRIGR